MALQKTKTINGFDAEYWRIVSMIYTQSNETDDDFVECKLLLYKDQATRNSDPTAFIYSETHLLDITNDNSALDGQGATYLLDKNTCQCYKIVKQEVPFFADAVDV